MKDVNTWLAKACTAIDWLSVIWKSDMTDKIKCSFFPSSSRVDSAIWMHYMDIKLTYGEKSLTAITEECCELYWTSLGDNTPQSSSYMATYYSSQKLTKLDEPDMQDTAGEVRTNSLATYSCGSRHMDEQKQHSQLEPMYHSSVPIQDVALKTYREKWMIEMGGKRGSGRSLLAAWHDDDDDDDNVWWWQFLIYIVMTIVKSLLFFLIPGFLSENFQVTFMC